MNKLSLNGKWHVKEFEHTLQMPEKFDAVKAVGKVYPATVPGDIHNDLVKAGIIPEPYFSDNSKECAWVAEKDWCFIKEFEVEKEFLDKYTYLNFEGIDTFSEVYLNGKKIGSTENMFLKYEFDVSKEIKEGKNILAVYIKSIRKMCNNFPQEGQGYFSCFNVPRIFIRKAQFQFSWDWAPDFPATGIFNDVTLISRKSTFIKDYAIRTKMDGSVNFIVNFDKNTVGDEEQSPNREFVLKVTDEGKTKIYKFPAMQIKNLFNIFIEEPKLWWPVDMGKPNLYSFTLSLVEEGIEVDEISGKFGIRELEFEQKPRKTEGGVTCQMKVNGQPVFLKGANWVPLDIMTGCIPDSKYEKSIQMAKEANFNCLRIWGGGIYEKDIFYNLCDEKGIMVWQDFMFACSDIPDDYEGFVDLIVPEIEYQVARLRNHPSIIVWCGGNEKTGSFGKDKCRGDRTIYYLVRGIAGHLDYTRPYFPSSPWGYSDVGNAQDSGDSHSNSYNVSMGRPGGVEDFRNVLAGFVPSMSSEIAVQGSPDVTSLKKYIPEDKLWPINDIYDLHFRRNPYDEQGGIAYSQLQMDAAERLFGEFTDVNSFTKKSMTVHSEFVRADGEYHRTRKGDCSAAMFWMYSDVWPCGTWAILDYFMIPKAAYYSAKRTFEPVSIIITQRKEGVKAFVVNDTLENVKGDIVVGQMTVDGKVIFEKKLSSCVVGENVSKEVFNFEGEMKKEKDSFLYAKFVSGDKEMVTTFFKDLWKDIKWPEPKLKFEVSTVLNKDGNFEATVTLSTSKYARFVNIHIEGQDEAILSDNFFDMMGDSQKVVKITSPKQFTKKDVLVKHWMS